MELKWYSILFLDDYLLVFVSIIISKIVVVVIVVFGMLLGFFDNLEDFFLGKIMNKRVELN